jgi:transposase
VKVRCRYRIYPGPGQQQALARMFGCARVVFNDCLRLREECRAAGETISDTEVQRRVATLAKRRPERAWLAEVASVALVQACQDACTACGAVHDRDVNAARNILAAGRADRLNACGGNVRPGQDLAVAVEAGTHRSVA